MNKSKKILLFLGSISLLVLGTKNNIKYNEEAKTEGPKTEIETTEKEKASSTKNYEQDKDKNKKNKKSVTIPKDNEKDIDKN